MTAAVDTLPTGATVRKLHVSKDIRAGVERDLYAVARGDEFIIDDDLKPHVAALQAFWDRLDPDPYYGGGEGCYRVRRYSDFDFDPRTGSMTRRNHIRYYQSERQNAYVGGKERHFGDVEVETVDNPFFHELVRYDFDQYPLPEAYRLRTWICQIHMIRIVVAPGSTTPITPEGVHCDGYPFAGVHLINRVGVAGGESSVYTGEGERLASLTFERPLDSLWFEDRRMKHYVTPISAAGEVPGHRDLLAISFSLPGSPYETEE